MAFSVKSTCNINYISIGWRFPHRDFRTTIVSNLLVRGDKEVILAAGSINSPKLLMLSGVGKATALRCIGIDVVENLPGDGENLQDHVLVSGVLFKYKGKIPDRPAGSNAVEGEAYLSSGPSSDADINLVLEQLPAVTPEAAARWRRPFGAQQLSGCRRDRLAAPGPARS